MVGDSPADDFVLRGFAGEFEKLLRKLPGGFDSFTTTGGEENTI